MRLTSTGKPRAKRTPKNAAALKAHDTRLARDPDAQRAAARKAVATKERNIADALKAAEERGAAKAAQAAKAKRSRAQRKAKA